MRVTKDSEERKNEFIDAAEKLFEENGIVDTTVNSIVKELNVAKGLFYYYFKSKDDVIEAISEKYNKDFKEAIREGLKEEDFDEDFERFMDNVTTSFQQMWSKFNNETSDMSQLCKKSMDEAKKTASETLKEILDEGKEEEKIEIKNTKYYADILISGISDLIAQGVNDMEEIKEIMNELVDKSRKGE